MGTLASFKNRNSMSITDLMSESFNRIKIHKVLQKNMNILKTLHETCKSNLGYRPIVKC